MIEIKRYNELSSEIKQQLDFYIQAAFGKSRFVQKTKWAIPHWNIIHFSNREIFSFYNVVERSVRFDNLFLKVAGINSVITPEKHSGKGFATHTLQQTKDFLFNDLNCDAGLLLCADSLVPFYERLNWRKVVCPVYVDQPDGKLLWPANTMILFKEPEEVNPTEIDLNGLPW